MFKIENQNIHMNRGDSITIKLESETELFSEGDIITMSIVKKGNYSEVLFSKEFEVEEGDSATLAEITLDPQDTKGFSPVIKTGSLTYWYEIELNQDGYVSTIVGYDDDGAKEFVLYPEAVESGSI